MPVETFNYLDSLNPANPPASDGLVGGDDHIRGLKAAVKASFPAISGPVTATHTELNNAAVAVRDGVTLLGSHAYDVNFSGLNFVTSTRMDLVVGGQTPVTLNSNLSVSFSGPVSAPLFVGPGCVPIGGMIMWLSDTLPSGYGGWAWANGQAISRASYPACFSVIGTTYGAPDASTFYLPNMQEVVPVGRSNMGSAGSPGLLPSISGALKAVLGGLFGSDTITLNTSQLPPYTPTGSVSTTTTITNHQSASPVGTGGLFTYYGPFANQGDVGTSASSSSSFSGNPQGGTNVPVPNTQPSRAVNFIIRIS